MQREHEKAVKNFKKMLHLAWTMKDQQSEIVAYDNLAIDYFYAGEVNKATYYHDRMMRGKVETDKSTVKMVSCNQLLSRRDFRHNVEMRNFENA